MQVTHHNVLQTQHTTFLQSDGTAGIGQAGSSDLVTNVSTLSANLAKSDLVNVGGAAGSQATNPAGATDPNSAAGVLLNPDPSDQNPLLPPHHH